MNNYCVRVKYEPNRNFKLTMFGTDIFIIESTVYVYHDSIVTRKYFNNYEDAVKYISNSNFKDKCYEFIQLDELFEMDINSDYNTVCRKLLNKGFIEYYKDMTVTGTTKYFKKQIDEDFTQFVSVTTTDGVNCRTDTEFFNLALIF